jgi:hypothetical protein
MSNTKITKLTLAIENLTEAERDQLRFVLSDAFLEYAEQRASSAEYIARHYPWLADSPGDDLFQKMKDVQTRCDLAIKLRNAVMTFTSADNPYHEITVLAPLEKDTGVVRTIRAEENTAVIRKKVVK